MVDSTLAQLVAMMLIACEDKRSTRGVRVPRFISLKHEISHIQIAEEIRTELVSSCSETENISLTGEPYDDTVNAAEPGSDLSPTTS